MENPEPFLHDLHGKVISVMLKWGWELRGILQSKDEYMNLLVPPSLCSLLTPKKLLMEKVEENLERSSFDATTSSTYAKATERFI